MYNSGSTYVEIYMENNAKFPSPIPPPTQLPRGKYCHWFSVHFFQSLSTLLTVYLGTIQTFLLLMYVASYYMCYPVKWFFFSTNNMSLEIFLSVYIGQLHPFE